MINKQCFEEDAIPAVLGLSFGLTFSYLEEGRKSVRHLCLCLSVSVSVSLGLSFDVAMSFRENEKSVAKSLSHVKICTQQHCKIQTNDGFTLVLVPALLLKH
jgi:hypothetical protein